MVSFDINEAADFLKIHHESLRRLAVKGEVPARKVGKRWVFIREHLADYVSGRYIQHGSGLRVLDGNAIKLSNLPITRNLQEGKYMDKKMGGRTMQIRNEFRSI